MLLSLTSDALGQAIQIPVLVARGKRPGPVVGITAAVHGNELNGIPVIHHLFAALEGKPLRGTVVGVVVANVPGLHAHQREFVDGTDLNHIFPGSQHGNVSQVYAHRLLHQLVARFDFLLDLHTASFGRINSLYVRADMSHPKTARMAILQKPQIILHNRASDGTLRGAAMEQGIPAITIEIADPHRFQPKYVRPTLVGVLSVLAELGLVRRRPPRPGPPPLLCERSYWMYTDRGGLLEVLPQLADRVEAGEVVARVRDAFGDLRTEYRAPESGVVIGKSTNPVGQTGARILHLGLESEPNSELRRSEPPPLANPPPEPEPETEPSE
ncbi:MAG: succinylglutamate desuccinylase/aspartoacylase family protein [Myxococcales bacterium]|nr:succinylglutamate desuccinylase/aspartoacylase family protein [Myxococcales bacterium]MCB9715515.1 succinylglutamate desuccinylase/aspartoacylase family protein [Myxococcales bacterium]